MPHTRARLASLREADQATKDEIDAEVRRYIEQQEAVAQGQSAGNEFQPGRPFNSGAGQRPVSTG